MNIYMQINWILLVKKNKREIDTMVKKKKK